jgi:hypothetical protein
MDGSHQKWSGLWHCFTHMIQLSDWSIFLEFPLPNAHGPWWCWKRGADAVATCDGDQQVFAGSKPLGEELHFLKYIYIIYYIYILQGIYIYIISIYIYYIYIILYIYYIYIIYILYLFLVFTSSSRFWSSIAVQFVSANRESKCSSKYLQW